MKARLTLHFDDYRPDDPSELVLRRKGAGWNDVKMAQERLADMLERVVPIMDFHDQLIVTMEVREPDSVEEE